VSWRDPADKGDWLLACMVIVLGTFLIVLLTGCTDIRNVMDYGVCSVRHQGCGQ